MIFYKTSFWFYQILAFVFVVYVKITHNQKIFIFQYCFA